MRPAGGIRLRLVGLALFATLPLVALGIYRLTDNALHQQRLLEKEAERAAVLAAARIDERIRTADALIVGLATLMHADGAQRAANEALLRRTLTRAPSIISNLFLLDTTGTLVATARYAGPNGDSVRAFANRGYFNIARSSRDLVVGELRRSVVLADHPWVVVLARAISDSSGRFAGIVSAPVRLDSLVSVATPTSEFGSTLVTIVDTSGVVLARSESPDSIVGRQRYRPQDIDTSGVTTTDQPDGEVRFTGFTRARAAPWIVNVSVSESALRERLATGLRADLLLFLLALALAVLMAALVGQRITQPLAALVTAARAFERGETGVRGTTNGPSEVRLLGSAFNQMAATVERRTDALADSERRYRFLFDSNPLPMWAWDADSMKIMAVNEAALDKYGYDRERFLSLKVVELLDPSELDRFGNLRLPFSENRQSAGTWLHRTATGRQLAMEIVTTSSRRLGRASWLSVGIDITARREAERALMRSEDQLRQVQKLEAIGTFAGGIAHDFNNLITGILGYCDLALSELTPESDAHRDVSEVRALAMRGSDLTRQILTVSRKQVVQPTRFDPNEVVRTLDRLLRRIVGAHISIEAHTPDPVGTMHADPGQFEQVLLNLTANARDAMPSGGTLRLATQVIDTADAAARGLPSSQRWILVTVSDTGLGMSADVQERIFEPFFTTKARGKGTGLGLALAHAMVEQAGGVIRVDSEPGAGTTFSLYFPQYDASTAADLLVLDAGLSSGGTETILFAEDEDSVRAVATAALERAGYRVLAAANGDAAVAIARVFPGRIDLLVTDVVMPGMNGRELAATLQTVRPGLPVLFSSGYADDETLLGDLRTDDRTFLSKPFTARELVRRVRMALDQPAHAV